MLFDLPRLLVFDLDGTLIDSRADLAQSVNATLDHFGQPPLSQAIISSYIGDGASELLRRSLAHAHLTAVTPNPHDEQTLAEALSFFLRYYRQHLLDHTTLYPGVLESLRRIRQAHPKLPMAVLTNKPVGPSEVICAHFGLISSGPDSLFFRIYGGDSFSTKKPQPEGLLRIIEEASALLDFPVAPAQTVMIGDSHVDVETARAAETLALGCTYGLSPQSLRLADPDALVDSAWDWPSALRLD